MMDDTHDGLQDKTRLEILQRTNLLDSDAEESFDGLTRLASTILKAPVSLVSLVEPDRQFFKSQIGLPDPWATKRETPISHSFCQHVVNTGQSLVIEDARKDPLVADNLAIRDLNVISYLGIPLSLPDGIHLGSLCVIDHEPRVWTQDDIETLQTLAQSVVAEIKLRLEIKANQESIAELDKRNAELDAFAHTVSHNLKNPISAIIGWGSVSTRYANRISEAELLDTIEKMGDLALHTNDIINALLLLAGIGQSGDIKIQKLNMRNIIDDALIQLEIEISTHDAQINLPDSGSFPPCFGYRAWVDEVWVNYISNAIKYGGRPPVITFSGEQLDNGFARYWIKDNGEGIPPEQQNKLFVPFRRLSQTSQHSGHGLGLAIVLQIIEKLGGEVGLESTPGDGSTFWFTLPTQAPDV